MNGPTIKPPLMCLDLGCGTQKKPGFFGVDRRGFSGVDLVHDLRTPWPWANESVGEVFCSHFVEHLEAKERVFFVNELYRVLAPGGRAMIVTPHWAHQRAYGDLTHKWPPVTEFWYYYLNKAWRTEHAPDNDFYTCDFDHEYDVTLPDDLRKAPHDQMVLAARNYRDVLIDLVAKLTKPRQPR